ncbi:hypothetical protein HG531_002510 [Fusarium graminearum]|nr:hypothetical protein HG531_002510 [Fusarium graminearum]
MPPNITSLHHPRRDTLAQFSDHFGRAADQNGNVFLLRLPEGIINDLLQIWSFVVSYGRASWLLRHVAHLNSGSVITVVGNAHVTYKLDMCNGVFRVDCVVKRYSKTRSYTSSHDEDAITVRTLNVKLDLFSRRSAVGAGREMMQLKRDDGAW